MLVTDQKVRIVKGGDSQIPQTISPTIFYEYYEAGRVRAGPSPSSRGDKDACGKQARSSGLAACDTARPSNRSHHEPVRSETWIAGR